VKDAIHPVLGIVIALWFGLCVGLTIWLLHPSPYDGDVCSVILTFVLFYVGAVIAKHTVLAVITIVERKSR
jgi:hypothetical protein